MKIIAHRGYWKPEGAAQNSLNATLTAIREKYDGLEVDVRMSKDQVLYLCHDNSYQGKVIRKTHSSELDQLKLENGEQLARFDEFIKIVRKHPNISLFLEIKSVKSKKYKRIITQKLIAQLKSGNLINNSVLLSFDIRILKYAATIAPQLSRMILVKKLNFNFYKIYYHKIDTIGFRHQLILKHPELIAQSKELGIKTNAWTVNRLKRIEKIAQLPVSSITTDNPNDFLKFGVKSNNTEE